MKVNLLINTLITLLCGTYSLSILANSLENEVAIKMLLEKANYWHSKSNYPLAYDALYKVFAIEQYNIEALYLMSHYKIQQGKKQEAILWINKLKKYSPNDQRIVKLMRLDPHKDISPESLQQAREWAKNGHIKQAIQAYDKLFANHPPTGDLALEYYETLAGSKAHLDKAILALTERVQHSPSDFKAQRILATVLTYQEKTRREGIQKLFQIENKNEVVIHSLKQALLWLQPNEQDLPLYQNFISLSPKDDSVMEYYHSRVGNNETLSGFSLLNKGHIAQAKQKFTAVLMKDPKKVDAIAGLGYVALHQKDYQQAEKLLTEAANNTKEHKKTQWLKDAQNMGYYSAIDTVKQLIRNKQYDKALILINETHASDTQQLITLDLFRGQLYRAKKDYSSAESLYQQLDKKYPNNKLIKEQLIWVFAEQKKYAEFEQLLQSLPPAERHAYQQKIDTSEQHRQSAAKALDNGLISEAEHILKNALVKAPQNAWLTLDYARVLMKKGELEKANAMMNNLVANYPSAATWHSALIWESEQNQWNNVLILINKIPTEFQSDEIITLKKRATLNKQIDIAQHYIDNGNYNAALNTLRHNINTLPDNPSDIGRLAQLYMDAGDNQQAVNIIRQNLSATPQGNLKDYTQQILILRRLGYYSEAESLMNTPALLSAMSEKEISNIRISYLSEQADSFRENGYLNEAWQILAPEIKNDPNNSKLLLSTARIYQANGQSDQATDIYRYILSISPKNQEALIGLVNLAISNKNITEAKKYFADIKPTDHTDYIVLSARLAQLAGDNNQAIKLLKTAQWGLVQPQKNLTYLPINHPLSGEMQTYRYQNNRQKEQLNHIETLLADLRQKTSVSINSEVQFTRHSGESGLSQLTELKETVTLSLPLFDDVKLALNVSPSMMSSGKTPAENASLVGSGALTRANRRSLVESDLRNDLHADEINERAIQGLESSMMLKGDNFQFDFGHTNSDGVIVSLVGGAEWMLETSPNSRLTFGAERRAVTDSLLSYSGLIDSTTGRKWGAVTRNAVSTQYAWDDSQYGAYAKVAINKYIGTQVPNNQSIDLNTGTYIYGINKKDKSLKFGANVHYMGFDKNLNHYTLGQAGYFSPQRYIAISLPVSYEQTIDKLSLKLNSTLGYQSYSSNSADYYPTDKRYQAELKNYSQNDEYIDYVYEKSSEKGFSYSINFDTNYKFSPSSFIGANVSYNTFGNYNETKANIYFKYLFDNDILGK
ncbi:MULTISPECIES: cellulose synthase subunit BcsC-related outer membrane protein [Providencia]|uniref:cellulose synthase subunit BcsC-related outer membrane protein n=2 Tax=Morganellaceae TaxID=1903414 RepID=UPI0022B71327|nr:cellulose synthase subunit BcsC-related outer membrane protein [Providencia sp. 21OH12SH02B-Prov]WBA56362.1 cellulose synthase subunit BcsC-related outer membrane protein [Providencia sp. 21OH12SH02B-Prov]